MAADGKGSDAEPRARTWTERLRALGSLLDQRAEPMRDVCVLDVGGGFVVQSLVPASTDPAGSWALASREYSEVEVGQAVDALETAGRPR